MAGKRRVWDHQSAPRGGGCRALTGVGTRALGNRERAVLPARCHLGRRSQFAAAGKRAAGAGDAQRSDGGTLAAGRTPERGSGAAHLCCFPRSCFQLTYCCLTLQQPWCPPSLRSRQPEKNHTMAVYVNADASYTFPGTLPAHPRRGLSQPIMYVLL